MPRIRPLAVLAIVLTLLAAAAGCGTAARAGAGGGTASGSSSAAARAGARAARVQPLHAPAGTARSCAATRDALLLQVARRIYHQAAAGRNVVAARRRLARSRTLAAAVATGDRAGVAAALRPLLKDQIKRIVVTRGTTVLASAGRAAAPGPISGTIRDGAGRPVGRYVLSTAIDAGLAGTLRGATGAQVVLRDGARTAGGLAHAPRRLPASGPVTLHGRRYRALSFAGTAFPAGPLRVWLLVPAAAPTRCATSGAATAADIAAGVARHVLAGERGGPATDRVVAHVLRDPALRAAVAHRDPRALRAAIITFFRDPALHLVRLRALTPSGRLIGDVGGPEVAAPVTRTLTTPGGRALGRVMLSVQDDAGVVKLVHGFTGAQVVLRTPAGTISSSTLRPGPPAIPARGVVRWHGVTYEARSFTTTAFPHGPLRVSVLLPA